MSSSPIDSTVQLTKPFSSDTETEKEDLLKEADLYRGKLESQWDNLKQDASGYGKQALIIGGVVVTTYLLLEAILPDAKKKENIELAEPVRPVYYQTVPKRKSKFAVGEAVQSLVWTLAIGWARKKLQNFIADDHESDENNKS
ncbi:hypothetical protein [Dyadobacter sp. CY356]|uniref:hypothetical protein n=1 Tax=Dyadobacter sp. CY356 TaxID=2906442 RepID=UPI001F377D0C|nr:hypothetical protein [Dyadobacter sp. CY356]MCF0057644.1 hypothetical protein [Dyadobacter sp. CY356]